MEPSSTRLKRSSKLLNLSAFEQRDELEELMDTNAEELQKLENGFNMVQNRTSGLPEKESYDLVLPLKLNITLVLQYIVIFQVFESITGGLLYGLLTEPQNAQKYFSIMSLLARDGWFCALCNVNMILFELYPRMRSEVREQIVYFFREAIKSNVPKIDNVLINYLRNANDGSDLKETCVLLSAVAGMLNDHHAWLSELKPKASLIPVTLLTFTRFICDLSSFNAFETLRTQMINVCYWLLTERFIDCAQLGRDLVLALMRVSKIPQFAAIWKQLLYNPNKLGPNISIEELMSRMCPHTFPLYRISVAMQRKLEFIFAKVKPGTHERHLDWFKKQYLSNPEAGSLRSELVRCAIFLSCGETPQVGQEMKAVFIASMFPQTSSIMEQQWCKLHLLWDWFCYDPATGGHVLIEPAFHVLRHLLHVQPLLANSLVDFMIRMSYELHPQLQQRIIISVTNSFKFLIDHSILGSPSVIFDNPVLQKNVRESFRDTFRGLFRPPQTVQTHLPVAGIEPSEVAISDIEVTPSEISSAVTEDVVSIDPSIVEDSGSVDEDFGLSCEEKIMTLLAAVKEEFREPIENLSSVKNSDNDTRCEMMQKLLSSIFDNDELLDEEQIELLSECLLLIFRNDIRNRKPLSEGFLDTPEILEEMFNQPLYVIFRNLCLTPDSDATRQLLLSLIAEICSSVSYLLLFFTSSNRRDQNDTAIAAYIDLCRLLDSPLIQQIVSDLQQCHIDDYVLFAHLIPYIYEKFATEAMGSVELMKLLAHSLDGRQIADLIGEMVRENISFFRKDSFLPIVSASLTWETTAQFVFWQLVHAEGVPVDWILQMISKLQYPKHSEAIAQVYIMLQRMDREPNMSLIRNLLSRTPSDMFTVNCLKLLIKDPDYAARVAELLSSLIDKLIQSGDLLPIHSKGKRPPQRYVCLDQLFSHLDKFRQSCLSKDSHVAEAFLARQTLQEAFTAARAAEKVSSLRIRYSELFAVMEILNDDNAQSARSLRRAKTSKKITDVSDVCSPEFLF
uniref:SOSS complex subunit A homolog n=1 Tax=Onchocerca volvulus TaxID=6282 RepID=A0A8R1XNE0_ONCVO